MQCDMCSSPQFAHTDSCLDCNASWARRRLRRPLESLRLGSGVNSFSLIFLSAITYKSTMPGKIIRSERTLCQADLSCEGGS